MNEIKDAIYEKGKIVLFYPTAPDTWLHVWFPFPYLYLGPFLEKEGFLVKIIDARVSERWRNILADEIKDAKYFGVTAMSGPDLGTAIEACGIVRSFSSSIPVIWGGHHARMVPEQILNEGIGDYCFTGRAEYSLVELLLSLENGTDYDAIKGMVYLSDGKLHGDRSLPSVEFDYDIFPAFHLLDIEKYRSSNNIVACFSSIGCPFSCSFCTADDFLYYYRTIEQVGRELDTLINKYKFGSIFFTDSIFFISKKRVLDIAKYIFNELPEIKWKAAARVNSLLNYTDKERKLLYDSGLRSVFFGVESGSDTVIKRMDKRITRDQVLESVKICKDYNLEFYASFIFATPYETIDDLQQTLDLIRNIKGIYPQAVIQNSIYLPLPGTQMYDMCVKLGYKPPQTTKEWAKREVGSDIQKRCADITWIDPNTLKEYVKIYMDEFPNYKHVYEREKIGEYSTPLK